MKQQVQLTGWKAVAAVVVVIALFGVRLMTFSDQRNNTELMSKLEVHVTSNYLTDQVSQLEQALRSGDPGVQAQGIDSVLSSRVTYHEVMTSYPLFEFSSSKEVVVKVVYSLDDQFGSGPKTTQYFLFNYGGLTDSWSYQRESSELSFYLNFL